MLLSEVTMCAAQDFGKGLPESSWPSGNKVMKPGTCSSMPPFGRDALMCLSTSKYTWKSGCLCGGTARLFGRALLNG
jgi:hypothetical protein